MKVIGFTYKVSGELVNTVRDCLHVVADKFDIFDLPSYKIDDHLEEDAAVVTFGKFAEKLVSQCIEEKKLINVRVLNLPSPRDLLHIEPNNSERRLRAWHRLQELKEEIKEETFRPTGLKITERDLPDLDAKHILLLQKVTDENNRKTCIQVTKGGKLIEISNGPLEDSKADIHLTFHELYTIRLIMDVLEVSGVTLVESSKASST